MNEKLINNFNSIKRKMGTRDFKQKSFWFALIIPSLIICFVFIIIPIIDSVFKSFMSYKLSNLVNGNAGEWNNFNNYIRLWEAGKLQSSIGITLYYVIAVTILTFTVGLTLAVILNSKIKGARVLRSIMMIPWVIPTIIGALLWSWIYSSPYGLLKYFVELFSGGEISNFAILNSEGAPLWGVIIVALWKQIPLMTLLILAGLQNVPEDISEAAKIDGASGATLLFKITLPQIKTVIKIALSMCVIENFKQYPLFAALTNGGPMGATTTLAVLSYDEAFVNNNFGSGAAVTTVWMIIMVISIVLYNRAFKEKD